MGPAVCRGRDSGRFARSGRRLVVPGRPRYATSLRAVVTDRWSVAQRCRSKWRLSQLDGPFGLRPLVGTGRRTDTVLRDRSAAGHRAPAGGDVYALVLSNRSDGDVPIVSFQLIC